MWRSVVELWRWGAGPVHPPSPTRSVASGEAPRVGGASGVTLPLGAGREGEAVRVASPADGSGTHHLGNPQSDVEHGLLSGRVIW